MLAVVASLAGAIALSERPALAACHSFTVQVEPPALREGDRVTVTVRRDAAIAPSQIDVSTADATATAGEDYEGVDRTVAFTDETQLTFEISTTDDDVDEPAETFRVRLSNPRGCSVNPSFVVGPPARVTLRDDDAAPPPTVTPSPTTEAGDETATPTPLPSPTFTERAAGEEDGGGLSAAALAGILAAALAIALVVAGLLWRRRGGP